MSKNFYARTLFNSIFSDDLEKLNTVISKSKIDYGLLLTKAVRDELTKAVRAKEVEEQGEYGFKPLDAIGEFLAAQINLKKKTLNVTLTADPKPYPRATGHYTDGVSDVVFYVVINLKDDSLDYEFSIEA